MRVGLCGYPGSGKSTVFGALAPGATGSRSGVAFGNIKVPDKRVDALSGVFDPKKKTYAEITFVDVGGGGRADTGALPPDVVQHMRNVDVLVHVVRGFANPMLATEADPRRDVRLFDEELLLIDMGVLDKRQDRWRRERRKGLEVDVLERCVAHLGEGEPLRTLELSEDEAATLKDVQLLSSKPLIVLYNLSEDAWGDDGHADLRETKEPAPNALTMALCGELEAEIAELPQQDQAEMLEGLGLGEPARNEFIRAAYRLLDLISFLTAGEDECRAWPIRRGISARRAAGKIHSDIERGFIRAEVYRWEDLIAHGSESALKSKGLMRLEGKDYVVVDGDVMNFRFNV
ncbi:MAG: redox-regulated ATPase YchF [Proteobacteria bacterium]|nr:MAG: redox-regulated ATPase YchF [Pseudomonadota bacterium]